MARSKNFSILREQLHRRRSARVTLEDDRWILKLMMEKWSEDYYAAGWLIDLEKTIQNEAKRAPTGEAALICRQAKRAGGWWVWEDKHEVFKEDDG